MFEMLDHNGPGHFGSSFALGFSEPNFVKKTHPPTPRSGVMAAKPPDKFKEDVAKLHKPLAAILVGKEIPWAAQEALGASGYVTVEEWPRPRPSRRCASFRQSGWQPAWSGGATKGITRRARRARRRRPWRSCVTGASWRSHSWNPEAEVGVPRE